VADEGGAFRVSFGVAIGSREALVEEGLWPLSSRMALCSARTVSSTIISEFQRSIHLIDIMFLNSNIMAGVKISVGHEYRYSNTIRK
jgi:hypothetical protein